MPSQHHSSERVEIQPTLCSSTIAQDRFKVRRGNDRVASKGAKPSLQDGFTEFLTAAIDRARDSSLLQEDDIKSYDPAAIVALPRLALLVAMLEHDWRWMKWEQDPRWILTKKEEQEAITSGKHWFRKRELQLQELALECQNISFDDRLQLEQTIVNGQGGTAFKKICSLADNLMISNSSFCKMMQSAIDDWKLKQTEDEVESLLI
ncbi:hypothetical protein K450DRAFT_272845 [Umbelopsis ramanniana AG]|uniref:Uncharacterized protein n=1 Tax=Umbelopsis ramanniana AG TaxID=1314678 RepID=A0AAD5HBR8_UMBRA|nr:uncharacterized protein K450DRAFT_272845 [Umbelopsis ramanniana AG]KAI8578430.1 hypothetical protein K450DRAFT_272845 [Umbelopsis ramanniana AG]